MSEALRWIIVPADSGIRKNDLRYSPLNVRFVYTQTKTADMEEKIIKALEEGGAMRPGDIATAAGVSKDDVTKAIKKLVADGKVYSPKRCFYDVKK